MALYENPCLIFLYIFLLMAVTWVFEWLLLLETGFTTYQLIEPLRNLSVAQLQLLLEARGIQYATLFEKAEIIESLQASGKVHYMELLTDSYLSESPGPVEILGKDEFHEQVLEENESVWVIEIIPDTGSYRDQRLLDDTRWRHLDKSLKLVGISTAVINCYRDPGFCASQGWNQPQLLMSVPSGNGNYRRSLFQLSKVHLTVNSIFNWISTELAKLVEKVSSVQELDLWLNTSIIRQDKIPRMIYITELLHPPLLLVSLGLRFSSRIRLALFNVRHSNKDEVIKSLDKHKLDGPPNLVVTTSESVSSYGNRNGEILTGSAMETYIKFLQPRMNDIFVVSLLYANFMAVLDFIDFRSSFWKHVIRTLFKVPVYNVFMFICWLTLAAVMKFSWTVPFICMCSWAAQKINSTSLAGVALYVYLIIEKFPGLTLIALFQLAFLLYVYKKLFKVERLNVQDQDSDNWYTIFPMDSYLVNVLFRPMASLSRPRPAQDLGLEEGMELLIERLATPDLWLHPVVSVDYINDLPCWRYDGWGNEEDLKSESETDFDSLSENENEILLHSHVCCQDEGCKMCTLWATVKETYVCHRCAILKRKLEKKYLWYRNMGYSAHQNSTHEKLRKVFENCSRTKRTHSSSHGYSKSVNNKDRYKRQWLLSAQRLHELKWTAPPHAIESRVCAICLDRYRWSAVLCGLPCGHTYHHSCIMEWLSSDNHQCPTCRWPSYKSKVHSESFVD